MFGKNDDYIGTRALTGTACMGILRAWAAIAQSCGTYSSSSNNFQQKRYQHFMFTAVEIVEKNKEKTRRPPSWEPQP